MKVVNRACEGHAGGQGHEGDEGRERACEGHASGQGHEGDEGRERPCEGHEGGGGPEGDEGDEGRERACEGHAGGAEGHEVSWGGLVPLVRSGSLLHAPAPVCVGVSTHSRRARAVWSGRRARTRVCSYWTSVR